MLRATDGVRGQSGRIHLAPQPGRCAMGHACAIPSNPLECRGAEPNAIARSTWHEGVGALVQPSTQGITIPALLGAERRHRVNTDGAMRRHHDRQCGDAGQ
jgi:hypothetical protein